MANVLHRLLAITNPPSNSFHGSRSLIFQFSWLRFKMAAATTTTHINYTVTAEERSLIMSNSTAVGLKAAVTASAVSGAFVAAANHLSPFFRHRLSISGKVSIVAMSGLACFSIWAEQDLLRASRNPGEYIAEVKGEKHWTTVGPNVRSGLPLWQRAANFVHDHPFRTVAFTAVPLVGAIYLDQARNPNIQYSQKIMHTRIYGQGTCVVLLLSTMAFYDYMSRRGPFVYVGKCTISMALFSINEDISNV
ncbi:unnamed protein product [Aphanomyces euteiches]